MASPDIRPHSPQIGPVDQHPRGLEIIQNTSQRLTRQQRGEPALSSDIERGNVEEVNSAVTGASVHLAVLKQGASCVEPRDLESDVAADMGDVTFKGFVQTDGGWHGSFSFGGREEVLFEVPVELIKTAPVKP